MNWIFHYTYRIYLQKDNVAICECKREEQKTDVLICNHNFWKIKINIYIAKYLSEGGFEQNFIRKYEGELKSKLGTFASQRNLKNNYWIFWLTE